MFMPGPACGGLFLSGQLKYTAPQMLSWRSEEEQNAGN